MSDLPIYDSNGYRLTELVPVIATFDTEGHLRPIYVRIHGTQFKVDSSYVKHKSLSCTIFSCKVIDGDRIRILILNYYHAKQVWGVTV